MREWQLPVVAIPFPDEAFGSWFGRLAKRYRIGVDELARQLDVQIDFGARCSGWLAAKPPVEASLARLAAVCRLSSEELLSLDPGESASRDFGFCESCFFLNPFDVTELYWKREWLANERGRCETHGCTFNHLSARAISRHQNLRALEKLISKRRRQRRDAWLRMNPYEIWCKEPKTVSSSINGHQ